MGTKAATTYSEANSQHGTVSHAYSNEYYLSALNGLAKNRNVWGWGGG